MQVTNILCVYYNKPSFMDRLPVTGQSTSGAQSHIIDEHVFMVAIASARTRISLDMTSLAHVIITYSNSVIRLRSKRS